MKSKRNPLAIAVIAVLGLVVVLLGLHFAANGFDLARAIQAMHGSR